MTGLEELSTEQLEALLAKKKKKDLAEKEKARKAYENNRDQNIEMLIDEATELMLLLTRFKQKTHAVMEAQAEALKTYGSIRSDSKGGFSISHSNGNNKITRRRDTDPVWDERAKKAEVLINAFLISTVKKRDEKLFTMLMGFLKRNQAGDLEYASVMLLIQHEHLFNDPRWIEGLRLFKESYTLNFKAYAYDFKVKNPAGKFERINLNIASL